MTKFLFRSSVLNFRPYCELTLMLAKKWGTLWASDFYTDLGGHTPIAQKAEAVYLSIDQGEPLKAECEHFLECVINRQQPLTDGVSGLQTLHRARRR